MDAGDLASVTGDGALMSALTAHRTGRGASFDKLRMRSH